MATATAISEPIARYSCCTLHLARAMRFLLLSPGDLYVMEARHIAKADPMYLCSCGRTATYFFRLMGRAS